MLAIYPLQELDKHQLRFFESPEEKRVVAFIILGAYRPISYIGFAFGTVYQYGLLRMMVSVVFADIENMPEYGFDFKALTVTLILFVLTYELVMYLYSRSIKRLSVKSVMLE